MAMGELEKKVDGVLGRFEQVLAETESALEALLRQASEASRLRQEREGLQRQLQELRTRAEELARANRQALAHVGAAKDRIRQALGEG